MTAQSVADMLDAWLASPAQPGPTAAKPAKAANRKDSCGPLAGPGACEALRIPANRAPEPAAEPEDSQTFAALRSANDPAQSEQSRGVSQDSQDSQGSSLTMQPRTCADCAHRLPRGTCAQPEAAGLFPPGHGFGIAWADEGHAANCPAFVPRMPVQADCRPYMLTRAEGDAAHADPWDDSAIGRFLARVASIRRRGFSEQDADDLAERLHLRDVTADHRITCLECRHLGGAVGRWRCTNHRTAQVGRELPVELVTMGQDCPGFHVLPELAARRTS